jgi:hypothetical protein
MDNFIKQVIDEKFVSKAQQGLFFAKAKHSKKWNKMAHEFADKTKNFKSLPYHKKEKTKKKAAEEEAEVDEIVDADGDIATGDMPGNPNAYIRAKKTTDQTVKSAMGQMGTFGILGGASGANKTLKYWAEADMSKALGAQDTIMNPKVDNYEDAEEYFEDELDVPEDEAKDRVEKLGYDKELPDGKIRLIENPKKYIEEYLAQKSKDRDFVSKAELEKQKKELNPILIKQLKSVKQSLKDNGLTSKDITEYLEDGE